ncbi:MAG: Tom37 metaxin N-terminal-like domain-containing protein, partial [Methylocystis silviterrae]|uniref:Tom37 metaxin N-terminal-like domain-containing protein n=1 Tax=Methylocystis silviterrae TaxID=2743612 RepID=UPI003C71B000
MTITLYCFRPVAGLPDASPFVTKAMVLLKMAGLDYVEDRSGFSKAPKGKQPYINDDGETVADSTFIRFHIEKKYGVDFDAQLSDAQKAVGWCVEKMCEEHLYWVIVHTRWMDDGNFER